MAQEGVVPICTGICWQRGQGSGLGSRLRDRNVILHIRGESRSMTSREIWTPPYAARAVCCSTLTAGDPLHYVAFYDFCPCAVGGCRQGCPEGKLRERSEDATRLMETLK